MKFNAIIFILLLSLIPLIAPAQKKATHPEDKPKTAAKQVLMRVIGMKAEAFTFEVIPAENGLDVYEVTALGGKVNVKGSSTIAMCRGAYDYLRNACNFQYAWSTDKVTAPASLPDFTIPRTVSPFKLREYYNVCAYGYTTAFWKWEEWQKELDWMALHGINMPVAMGGQEAIWQKVFKSMGMTDAELRTFFNGPAFLPWQRMGNLNHHDSPLPQSYIDGSKELQVQLMQRMAQLGMTPIVPGFSGFVPAAYKRLYPDVKVLEVKQWCSFPDSNMAYILPPGSADFVNIGKKFIEEYKATYGNVHYFLADLFNENEVPVTEANRYNELAEFGKSAFESVNAADPEGIWVMQGWLFYNNRNFWDKESVKAFLSKVPDNRMLIIDLANEEFHGWEKLDGFFGKPWIYSIIHNYGGKSQMVGNLPLYATDAAAMLASPKKAGITGFGISPEGILNNEVVYELLTDVSWSSKPIDIKAWLKNYARQRYGKDDENLFYAWLDLLESIYSVPTVFPINIYQVRPGSSPTSNLNDHSSFDKAVGTFLSNADEHMSSSGFKHDLVQMVVQFAGMKADGLITRALQLQAEGDTSGCQVIFGKVRELMLMMDALTYSLPDQRLETWTELARKWGTTKEESDYYEADAKRQVTMWGNASAPVLYEYAAKVWSGLIRDYYMPRWMNYASSLKTGQTFNFDNWEENWIRTPGLTSKAPVTGDLLNYAKLLYNTAGTYSVNYKTYVSIQPKALPGDQAEINFVPLANSPDDLFTPARIAEAKKSKADNKKVKTSPVRTQEKPATEIRYTLDGSMPNVLSPRAEGPVTVALPATITARAFYNGSALGYQAYCNLPVSYGKSLTLNPQPSSKYFAKGGASLNDARFGKAGNRNADWLGFEGDNMNATIDLEKNRRISEVVVNYFEHGNAWIFGPSAIGVLVSADGKNWTPVYSYDIDIQHWSPSPYIRDVKAKFPETEARYVKVVLYNRGTCPPGSYCAGKKSWLFVDEIQVR